ncbi:MAG: hypothetical protein ACP5NX_00770 [Candidatus Bilamarchaeaceae archaeon]
MLKSDYMMSCERCGEQTVKLDKCGYCSKMICRKCLKSGNKTHEAKKKRSICKTCWGDIGKRTKFKSTE